MLEYGRDAMSEKISLKQVERKAYQTVYQDGLWDVLIGSYALMFAIIPALSVPLGDFWSSALLIPAIGLVYAIIWLIRKYILHPRTGRVELGAWRIARLKRANLMLFVVLTAALLLGALSFLQFDRLPGWVHTLRFSSVILIGFGLAGYLFEFPRLYAYGLMLGAAPILGEWLYQEFGASHHGIPITFTITGVIIILTGLFHFVRLLRQTEVAPEETGLAGSPE
jgi:hypothetical protein